METDDEGDADRATPRPLSDYADAGGYDLEVTWDYVHRRLDGPALRPGPAPLALERSPVVSRSGWCWSTSCAAPTRCCCSTSRTTTSTCPARSGWRSGIRESAKTILFISHDRELLANTATRIVTVELGSAGNLVWTHPGGFASYHEARERPVRALRGACAAAGTRSTPRSRRSCCGYKIKAEYN